MKSVFILALGLMLTSGCADPNGTVTGKFYDPRIERELKYYIATHPLYSTNHFYVGAMQLQGTNMVSGIAYWKEENILLPYDALNADATDDIFAWPGEALKLGRDTVKSYKDLNGSTYLITEDNWHDWVRQCMAKGKRYTVSLTDARKRFPNAQVLNDE